MAINKQYWTAADILERVKDELDLQEETYIDDVEMLGYANAAIDRAEQQVIGIHKDYFLSRSRIKGMAYVFGDYATATNDQAAGTSVLAGAVAWPTDIVGDEIAFSLGNYVQTFTILSVVGDTITVDGKIPDGAGQGWEIYKNGIFSGQREYRLPKNIYAHKIRRVIYHDGSQVYKVTRIQDWKKFERKAINDVNNSATLFEYFLVNDTPGIPKMLFVPIPFETGDKIEIWYLRQANRFDRDYTTDANNNRILDVALDDPSNILDVPEAFNYVVEFTKMKCDIKEKRIQGQIQTGDYPEVQMEYKEFIGVIEEIVPDAENLIEPDYSIYEEHS